MDADVIAWASAGYLLCFCVGLSAGILHRAIIRIAEGLS